MSSQELALPATNPMVLKCAALDSTVLEAAGRQCHHCSAGLPLNLRHRYLVRGFMHCGQFGRVVCLFCNALHVCPYCVDYANKERVHICGFTHTCGMYLSTSSALELHEGLTHHSSPSFCGLCNHEIKNFVEHCKTMHPEIDPNELAALDMGNAFAVPAGMKLQCPFCEACFNTEHDVRMHVLIVHQCRSACGRSSSSEKTLPCRECQQIKLKGALLLHGQSQLSDSASTGKDSVFPCEICDGVFHIDDRVKHMLQAHLGALFTCEFCPRKFSNKELRENHMKSQHSEEMNLKGAFCGRLCDSPSDRRQHERGTHEDEHRNILKEQKADFADQREGHRSCRKTKSGSIVYGNYFELADDFHNNDVVVSGSVSTDPKGNAKSALADPGSSAKEEPDEYSADELMPSEKGAMQGKEVGAGYSASLCDPPKAHQQGHETEQYRRLFVGGLTHNTTDEMLKDFYSRFGVVARCFVVRDNYSNRSRGFGFVTFDKSENVDIAMRARPHIIDRKAIEPKRALPKTLENQVSVKKLCVSGITREVTEQNLKKHFAAFGTVSNVEIMLDKEGRTRGFAFVTFDDYDPIDKCIRERQERGAQSRGSGADRWRGASDVGYGPGGGHDAGYDGGYVGGRLGDYGGRAYGGYGRGYEAGWDNGYGHRFGGQGGWSGNEWLGSHGTYGGQQGGWYQQTQGYSDNGVGFGGSSSYGGQQGGWYQQTQGYNNGVGYGWGGGYR